MRVIFNELFSAKFKKSVSYIQPKTDAMQPLSLLQLTVDSQDDFEGLACAAKGQDGELGLIDEVVYRCGNDEASVLQENFDYILLALKEVES